LVAEAVKKLIEVDLGLNVLAISPDAKLLPDALDKLQPDLILFVIYKSSGALECARQIKATHPAIKIVVLTSNENPKTALDCMNSWASGYLLMKSAEELVKAVRLITAGSKYLSPNLQKKFEEARWRNARFQSMTSLTSRQRQVLELVKVGCTMKEIAANLHITARTVAFHKYRIMSTLGAKNNAELLRISLSSEAFP
jgi:DNA-binding NarL/FixJ family response regulator